MNDRKKLTKAFGEGSFGMPDLPNKMGLAQCARLEQDTNDESLVTKGHRRSWKRHRKQRWRPK